MKSVQSTGKRLFRPVQRPAGQSAKSWMDENGIREQSYYHWQQCFREQAYEEMKENASVPAVAEKAELTFVEVPCHTSTETNTYMVSDKPAATIRTQRYRSIFPMKFLRAF